MSQQRKIKRNMGANFASMSEKAKYLGLVQNGITPEMLDNKYREGRRDGREECIRYIATDIYSAILVVLKDRGMGQDEMIQMLLDINSTFVNEISSVDLAKRLIDEAGIEIDLDDPVAPIRKVREID